MAFKVPTKNCWCRVWRHDTLTTYVLAGYEFVQIRGTDSHPDPVLGALCVQVLFPKGADVRQGEGVPTTQPDHIEMAGQLGWWLRVEYVTDKGSGFSNEYRIATCFYVLAPGFPDGTEFPPVNVELLPDVDYIPLPTIDPSAVWGTPTP